MGSSDVTYTLRRISFSIKWTLDGKTWSSGAIFWDHRDKDLRKKIYMEKLSSFIGIHGFYSQLKCWQHNWADTSYASGWFLIAKSLQTFLKDTVILHNKGKTSPFLAIEWNSKRKKQTNITFYRWRVVGLILYYRITGVF